MEFQQVMLPRQLNSGSVQPVYYFPQQQSLPTPATLPPSGVPVSAVMQPVSPLIPRAFVPGWNHQPNNLTTSTPCCSQCDHSKKRKAKKTRKEKHSDSEEEEEVYYMRKTNSDGTTTDTKLTQHQAQLLMKSNPRSNVIRNNGHHYLPRTTYSGSDGDLRQPNFGGRSRDNWPEVDMYYTAHRPYMQPDGSSSQDNRMKIPSPVQHVDYYSMGQQKPNRHSYSTSRHGDQYQYHIYEPDKDRFMHENRYPAPKSNFDGNRHATNENGWFNTHQHYGPVIDGLGLFH